MELLRSLAITGTEEVLSVSGLILLLAAAWGGDKASRAISIAAVAVLTVCAVLTVPALTQAAMGPEASAWSGQFSGDAFAAFGKLLVYVGAAVTLIVAPAFFEREKAMRAEFPLLVLLASMGMGMIVSATDMLALYIGLELNSLAAYVMASFLRSDERSAEAGLKYFVLGSLASGILLYGISLTYGFTGSTSFAGIHGALAGTLSTGTVFGVVFVLAGLAFKVSAAPFHMWTPDVYEGAPTPVTTFFATAPKVAALGLLMRVSLFAFGAQPGVWQQIVIFVALLSIVIGALGAIGQDNIKRLLAYSSINNVGFMLIGLACANQAGAAAMLVYLAIYVAMSVAGFVAVLMLRDADGAPVESIKLMAGLSKTRPMLALGIAAVMFSLAGIPPLLGFWGKFVVFQAAVQSHQVILGVIGILGSVPAAFYYIKVVKVMYFDEAADVVTGQSDMAQRVLLFVSVVAISPLGYLLTKSLGALAGNAAAALFHIA